MARTIQLVVILWGVLWWGVANADTVLDFAGPEYANPEHIGAENPRQVTYTLLRLAVNARFSDQMPQTDARMWARIQEAFLDGQDAVSLSNDAWGWLLRVVREADRSGRGFPPDLATYRIELSEYLERLEAQNGETPAED